MGGNRELATHISSLSLSLQLVTSRPSPTN